MPVLPSGLLVLETLAEHHGLTLTAFCLACDRSHVLDQDALAVRFGWTCPCRTFGVVSAATSADSGAADCWWATTRLLTVARPGRVALRPILDSRMSLLPGPVSGARRVRRGR